MESRTALAPGQRSISLTARYTAAACCSGYEFPSTTLALSFGADGSTSAGSDAR